VFTTRREHLKYHIDFQYLPKSASRPLDDGEVMPIAAENAALIPNVGDYVQIIKMSNSDQRSSFDGKVKSRLFRYFRIEGEESCAVNIVVEEDDDDWGLLIKE
jgi:hypothetical protein